jgi:hypothetical protein
MWIIGVPSVGIRPKEMAPGAFCATGATDQKESACKPGSVESNHSSGICVAANLEQPTRKARGPRVEHLRARPSLFGLAPDGVYLAASGCPSRGALLPHHFTLARSLRNVGGLLSVALSVGSRRPDVIWRPARWSPDFPPACCHASGCSANSGAESTPIRPRARPPRARRGAPRSPTVPCVAARSARPRAWRPSTHRAP